MSLSQLVYEIEHT